MALVGATRLCIDGVEAISGGNDEKTDVAKRTEPKPVAESAAVSVGSLPSLAALSPAAPQKGFDEWMSDAQSLSAAQRWSEAAKALDEAIRVAPPSAANNSAHMASLYSNRGAFLIMSEDFRAAVPVLEKATQLAPRDDWAFVNLGLAHMHLSEKAAAEKALTQALEIAPKNADAKSLLDQCRAMAGN